MYKIIWNKIQIVQRDEKKYCIKGLRFDQSPAEPENQDMSLRALFYEKKDTAAFFNEAKGATEQKYRQSPES